MIAPKLAAYSQRGNRRSTGDDIASVTEKPHSRRILGSARATVAANTGSFTSNCTPIADHCEPCPEHTHTGPRSSRPSAAPYGVSPTKTQAFLRVLHDWVRTRRRQVLAVMLALISLPLTAQGTGRL